MEKTGAAQATRSRQESAVMLNPTQIGLAVGVVGVCCLMAFGGGVIAGMWYKASEQSTPYAALTTLSESEDAVTVSQKAEELLADSPVTFYDTLKGKTKYAPLHAAPGNAGTTKIPLPAPGTPPATSAKTAVASVPSGSTADTPKTSLPAVTAGNSSSTRTTAVSQNSAPNEQNKSTSAAASLVNQSTKTTMAAPASGASRAARSAVAPAVAKATAMTVKPAVASSGTHTPGASAKDTASATASRVAATTAGGKDKRSDTDAQARRQAEVPPATTAAAARSGDGQYSVQAGSFRSPEQAERLRSQLAQKGYQARVQLFTAPNNESWYRVRVGNYNDRSAAGQTAQNLTSREQLQTVVANDQR